MISVWAAVFLICLDPSLALNLKHMSAAKAVTPCTQYNSLHTMGDRNCLACTQTYFKKDELTKPDYAWVRDNLGQFFPMKRPVPVELKYKNGDVTCQWCPTKQLCGHQDDPRVTCPGQENEENGGWMDHDDCLETDVKAEANYRNWEKKEAIKYKILDKGGREEKALNDSKKLTEVFNIKELETQNIHNRDTFYDCLGACVESGLSQCNEETLKILKVDPSRPQAQVPTGTSHTDPVPCKLSVDPARALDSGTAYRVHGVFSPSHSEWVTCRLIACDPPPQGTD